MPLCVSCQGEYPPPRKTSQANERNEEEQYLCPRCGQNNRTWAKLLSGGWRDHLVRFFLNFWGLLLLSLLILLTILILLLLIKPDILTSTSVFLGLSSKPSSSDFQSSPNHSTITFISVLLGLFLVLASLALLYILKEALWRYDLLARVGHGFLPTLLGLALISFILATICGTGSVTLAQIETPTLTPSPSAIIKTLQDLPTDTPTPTETPTPTPSPTLTPIPTPTYTPSPIPKPCCRPCFHSCWQRPCYCN